MIFKLFEATMA